MIIVLIDGRSGSGKTTIAQQWARETGFQLIHMDDFYPGWSGLVQGSKMVAHDVLHPSNPGFWSWDWESNSRDNWVSLIPGRSVIVEGAGALSEASKSAALSLGTLISVEVRAPEELRKTRALARDPYFAPFWKMWADQEDIHFSHAPKAEHEIVLASDSPAGRPAWNVFFGDGPAA